VRLIREYDGLSLLAFLAAALRSFAKFGMRIPKSTRNPNAVMKWAWNRPTKNPMAKRTKKVARKRPIAGLWLPPVGLLQLTVLVARPGDDRLRGLVGARRLGRTQVCQWGARYAKRSERPASVFGPSNRL